MEKSLPGENSEDGDSVRNVTSKINKQDQSKPQPSTLIAKYYLVGYMIIIGCCFIFSYCVQSEKIEGLIKLFSAVNGLFSAGLGFILGYYFKNNNNES